MKFYSHLLTFPELKYFGSCHWWSRRRCCWSGGDRWFYLCSGQMVETVCRRLGDRSHSSTFVLQAKSTRQKQCQMYHSVERERGNFFDRCSFFPCSWHFQKLEDIPSSSNTPNPPQESDKAPPPTPPKQFVVNDRIYNIHVIR